VNTAAITTCFTTFSRELTETEPELVPELHRRAADWYEENGDPESGLEHADASGDKGRVASRRLARTPAYEAAGSRPSRPGSIASATRQSSGTRPLP
jgi:hypothetical protein